MYLRRTIKLELWIYPYFNKPLLCHTKHRILKEHWSQLSHYCVASWYHLIENIQCLLETVWLHIVQPHRQIFYQHSHKSSSPTTSSRVRAHLHPIHLNKIEFLILPEVVDHQLSIYLKRVIYHNHMLFTNFLESGVLVEAMWAHGVDLFPVRRDRHVRARLGRWDTHHNKIYR